MNQLDAFHVVLHGTGALCAVAFGDKCASIRRGWMHVVSANHHIIFGVSRIQRKGRRRHVYPVHNLLLGKICDIPFHTDAVFHQNPNRLFIMEPDANITQDLHCSVMDLLFLGHKITSSSSYA